MEINEMGVAGTAILEDVIRERDKRIADLEAQIAALTAECERLRERESELIKDVAVERAGFKDSQRVIADLSNRLKDVLNQERWIPVIEKYPQLYTVVLLFYPRYGRLVGFRDGNYYSNECGNPLPSSPTHWRELPEPPKEDTE